ncbi:hypothetical protein AOY20_09540 [Acinetobacter equi]|uniref:Uncharacterized protein n=1 Tax=Acinetobacter equi TaxID=1324350 RepID=A0A0N9W3U8_9GAMM|nr:hypothetical protein AOY20_09540 [Acinetobacter equi]
MNHKLKCKLYIYLSIIIVLLIIVYIFVHTVLMKSIVSVQNLGHKLSVDNILNKNNTRSEHLEEKNNEIKKVENEDKNLELIKLKDFSITLDSLTRKKHDAKNDHEVLVNGAEVEVHSGTGLNIYSNHAEDIDIALVEESLEVEQKSTVVVSEKNDTEKTQKEYPSLEIVHESQYIVANELFDNENQKAIEHIKEEIVNENSALNPTKDIIMKLNTADSIDTIIDKVANPSIGLISTESILVPEIVLTNNNNDITEINPLSNLIATETNDFLSIVFPSCERKEEQIDLQSELISRKIEALEKTLAFDNHLNENVLKHADLAEIEIISPSSAKKLYAMQATDKSANFKKVVATYQKVSDLYK